MSYCRWSSNNFKCDVYCYQSAEGFVTHVASHRVVGDVPKLPDLGEPADAFVKAWKAQSDFVTNAKRTPIGLPHAGESFTDPDMESFLARLVELKKAGYEVPDDVINDVGEEIKEAGNGTEEHAV